METHNGNQEKEEESNFSVSLREERKDKEHLAKLLKSNEEETR